MQRREFVGSAALLLASAGMTRIALARDLAAHSVQLQTLGTAAVRVEKGALAELGKSLHGDLLLEGMPGYDSARYVWNAAIDRRPALIARCADTHDIVRAVQFAERYNALVSVRAGGHNSAGFAVCDSGLTIDLTRMRQVAVDAQQRTATVDGGATFADYDAATHNFGLASTGPVVSMVGVGGYTLGGGMGWLHRKLGLACDLLVSAEVITADGRVVQASEREAPDLFWAIRGGGGNFGVVSSFKFRVAPVSSVLAGLIFHPLEELPRIAALLRDFNATAPDEVCVWLMMRKVPASSALPRELHGRPVAVLGVCYAGTTERGEQVLQPLRQFGRPLLDQVKPRAYADWQHALDPAWGNGFGNRWTGHYLAELTDASAQTLMEHVSNVSSPFTDVKVISLGGAVARVSDDETACGQRRSGYALAIQTRWQNPRQSREHMEWSRALFDAMKSHGTGKVYVNFVADEGEERVKAAYSRRTFARLRAVKKAYDPLNRFRMNQNIRPA